MEIFFKKIKELEKTKLELEKKLGVKLNIVGKKIELEGEAYNEYEAQQVLEAVQFGFPIKRALLLKDENFIFIKMPIKHFTRRKDMKTVKGRLIGADGKTKRTLEELTNSYIIINENTIGFIAPAEDIKEVETAITNLIRGTKEANIYRFLEKMNTVRKHEI